MRYRGAFSLVELSIVLVILGLLVGGILAGQSLIRAAELRGVVSEAQRFTTASHAFRDKYFGLPGDITNASSFWGIAGGTTGNDDTCRATASTDARTCNGDGDGIIQGTTSGATYSTYNEQYRFWQHLANAGLIEGRYVGVDARSAGYSSCCLPGIDISASRMPAASWGSRTLSSTGSSMAYLFLQSNIFLFGKVGLNATVADSLPLKPEEAWNIDTKLDDGKPGSGSISPYIKGNGTTTFCTSTAGINDRVADAASTYRLDNTNRDCLLIVRF